MTVDDKLTWVPYMLDLKKSFAKKLDLIRRSSFLPKDVLVNLYVRVYSLALSSIADLLDSLESRAARIIYNLPKDMRSLDVLENACWHCGAFFGLK